MSSDDGKKEGGIEQDLIRELTAILTEGDDKDAKPSGKVVAKSHQSSSLEAGAIDNELIRNRRKPLNDLRVRQAIAYAINRDDIVQFIGTDLSSVLYSVVPASFLGGLKTVPDKLQYRHDPDKAKRLLAAAGLPNGFAIDPVFISERPQFRRPMEIIQNQLGRVGIKINISVVAHPAWHEKNDEGSNPLVLRAATRFPTASFILEEFFVEGAKRNFSHFNGASAAIKQAQETLDLETQKRLWREAQIDILEDMAAFPTHILNTVVARKSTVDLGFPRLESALSGGMPIKWNAQLT